MEERQPLPSMVALGARPANRTRIIRMVGSLVSVAGLLFVLAWIALHATPSQLTARHLTPAARQAAKQDLNRQWEAVSQVPPAGAQASQGVAESAKAVPESLDQPHASTTPQDWSVTLTGEQMQIWLEEHLPAQPSFAIPGDVSEPRVILGDQHATFACNFASSSIRSVVSLDLEPFPVDQPNRLGIRIHGARAGWLPVPLSKVIWRMAWLAHEAGLHCQCIEKPEMTHALLTLPAVAPGQQIRIRECRITPAGLALKGTTDKLLPEPTRTPTIGAH